MAFKTLSTEDQWKKALSRVLVIGQPNTWKTSSVCRTWDKPIHVVSYPGEKGSASIPRVDGVTGYVWEEDDPSVVKLNDTIKQIEDLTWEILTGKRGEIATFFGDGLHKLAACYWRREYQKLTLQYADQLADGKTTEDKIRLQSYGNENYGACKETLQYISRVSHSSVQNVVFSTWEGREVDDPDAPQGSAARKNSHIFADLPGKLARQIVGEFSVVLRSEVSLPGLDGKQTGTWQIKPKGKVWGVGVKGPIEIVSKLPAEVPMDWQKLRALLTGEDKK